MRVLVIDDHSIIRMALKHILADLFPDVDMVQAANGSQGLSIAEDDQDGFDLVITDLYMPEGGIDTVARLAATTDPAPVVVFTVSERPADVRGCLASGARAYIPKTTENNLILSILRLVMAGGSYMPPTLSVLVPDEVRADPTPLPPHYANGLGGHLALAERVKCAPPPTKRAPALPTLTRRQYQVLELLAEGLSNAEIGQRLTLNLSTVKSHVTGVLRALGVSSRTQAVLMFKRSEWARD